MTKYYYAGSQRIAMRANGNLFYLLGDHLGSTSLTTDANGTVISELRYKAWGDVRHASGTTPTQYQYTGQYSHEFEFGLYFYHARWLRSVPVTKCRGYDPYLSRFAQADSIVPPGMQGLDRYAYANNNPLYYTDPDGHFAIPVAIIIGVIVLTKAIDYGWTTYDAWQSTKVLNDPTATDAAKALAATNLAMTAAFEAAEPDDVLPIGLPLDDLARHGVLKLGDEVLEHGDDLAEGFIRVVREDWVGTSQAFKTDKLEDGLSVFKGVTPEDVLKEMPGKDVPNTTVIIPNQGLPLGTQIIKTPARGLSEYLSDAHHILVRPQGWSIDRFAKAIKNLVGWE